MALIHMAFLFYAALMAPLCVKVADASSWKIGWTMATALVFFPLALLIASGIPPGDV
ncbi:hypothetical protein PV416_24720 [Streptomyces ipomoeae]|uniref:Uncharacterized protein n=1 Tax=Streptomyces ipomoeae 91-03 TaxID=698759 RepID=L1KI66_9ACTN|nr:hypothetical protein [Streptomyces ipomoeae]EKX60093.1 hypothetical protein STRIP9103_04650 [Streptomyces ipomoeae 91-03]MDX2700814.1 hypothetical protein [Streptomyces ipomoeae]MDX2824214.1 hypothetical protein [Streptomyces ipomoeae]MDX2846473.1 hypothetical protein [Streptomyces ipomoeae]MDX2881020.1 hypothetical protein [Streptomyces ipomoeae]